MADVDKNARAEARSLTPEEAEQARRGPTWSPFVPESECGRCRQLGCSVACMRAQRDELAARVGEAAVLLTNAEWSGLVSDGGFCDERASMDPGCPWCEQEKMFDRHADDCPLEAWLLRTGKRLARADGSRT